MNKSSGMLTMRRQAREVYAGRLSRQRALAETPPNRASLRVGPLTNQYSSIIPVIDLGAEVINVKEAACISVPLEEQ